MEDINSSVPSFIKIEIKEEELEEACDAALDDVEIKYEPKYAEMINEPIFETNSLGGNTSEKLLLLAPTSSEDNIKTEIKTDVCNMDMVLSSIKSEEESSLVETLKWNSSVVNGAEWLEGTIVSSLSSYETLNNYPFMIKNIHLAEVAPNNPVIIHEIDKGLRSILKEEATVITVTDACSEASLGIGSKSNDKEAQNDDSFKFVKRTSISAPSTSRKLSNSEKCKRYRERKRLREAQAAQAQNDDPFVKRTSVSAPSALQRLANREKCRRYRERIRLSREVQVSQAQNVGQGYEPSMSRKLTNSQRCKLYRDRKRSREATQVHAQIINSYRPEYGFDFNSINNQDFTTSQKLQNENENPPPENTSECILPAFSEVNENLVLSNIKSENAPPTFPSKLIAPISSQNTDDKNWFAHNIIHKESTPSTEKNNISFDYLQNYSDSSDNESSESEYYSPIKSVASDSSEDYQDIISSVLKNDEGNSLEKHQDSERKNKVLVDAHTETEKSANAASTPSTSQESHKKCLKNLSARERPTLCPFCFQDVITHFPRHLLRRHKDRDVVKKIIELGPKNKERTELITALRKQGYFYLKIEKKINNPVRSSNNPNADYAVCQYCLGEYSKFFLYRHVRQCKSKPAHILKPGRKCLSNSQTFMASMRIKNDAILKSLRIKEEVFQNMLADDISLAAKSDVLICLYGEVLLSKYKSGRHTALISSKIREMAKMLITLRSINPSISNLFDALRPDFFRCFVAAAKNISGYDPKTKSFRAPSLALHMRSNLRMLCSVAYKVLLERKKLPTIAWENFDTKRQEIKDFKKLVERRWRNEISTLALKTLKERKLEKPIELPLTGDILVFQNHIYEQAEIAYEKLIFDINDSKQYEILTECILAHTIMFNRKRGEHVQYLTIQTYTTEALDTEQEALTEVEKILSQQFKRVVSCGRGSKPVAILFNKKMQAYINHLLQIRETSTVVPKSNPYLFAHPGSERKRSGKLLISRLAKNCGAERPAPLASSKFRKHIATTLQLMDAEPGVVEQLLATFMGDAQFYRLPQDVHQTAKMAKLLLLVEKGKGGSFKGKSINDVQLFENDIYYSSTSSESEDENEGNNMAVKKKLSKKIKASLENSTGSDTGDNANRESHAASKQIIEKQTSKIFGRIRWKPTEKNLVKKYFAKHIRKKITPKKHECSQFLVTHGKDLRNKDWVRVKTFVYNTFRQN